VTRMGTGPPGYQVSKAALNALTRTLAAELERDHILVNAVCPGSTATDMGRGRRSVHDGAASVVWGGGTWPTPSVKWQSELRSTPRLSAASRRDVPLARSRGAHHQDRPSCTWYACTWCTCSASSCEGWGLMPRTEPDAVAIATKEDGALDWEALQKRNDTAVAGLSVVAGCYASQTS
jgi:hypothetical protein